MAKTALLFSLMLIFVGCERPTKVQLKSADGLEFKITGHGSVGQLTIFGSRYREEATSPSDQRFVIWMIEPVNGYLAGPPINRLHTVTYGKVPNGYRQIIPANDTAPEPLLQERPYLLRVSTVGATGFGSWFVMKSGTFEFVKLKGPCFQDDLRGQPKRVPCQD